MITQEDRVEADPPAHALRVLIELYLEMSTVILWIVTTYSLVGDYQGIGGTYCLHLQGKDTGNMFLRNVGNSLQDRKLYSPEDHNCHIHHPITSNLKSLEIFASETRLFQVIYNKIVHIKSLKKKYSPPILFKRKLFTPYL
jgi:hypothetical protein